MGKKKKEEKTKKDKFLQWGSMFAGMIFLGCCVPRLSYRYAEIYQRYHARFAIPRRYALWGATNRHMQTISWMSLRRAMCQKFYEYNMLDPMSALLGSTLSSQGGAIATCKFWNACKSEVNVRCSNYTTMMCVSIFCLLSNIVGATLLLFVPMFINNEYDVKGKGKKKFKKKLEAVTITTGVVAGGFVLPFFSWAMFMGMSEMMFKQFQKKEAYPFGYAHAGHWLHSGGNFIAFIGLLIAAWRYRSASQKPEKEDDDEDGDAGGEPVDDMGGLPPGGPPGMPL